MGQEPTPVEPGQEPEPVAKPAAKQEPKVYDQDYVQGLRSEAAGYRTENNALKERLAELEDKDKSEAQKLAERAEAAERLAAETQTALLRLKVGQAKGLPAEVAELLHGTDEQEMSAHADRLLAAGIAPKQTPPDFDGGVRSPAPKAGDMNGFIRAGSGLS